MDTVYQSSTQLLALGTPTAVSWFAFIVIGGIAGWLAGKIVKGSGSGILLDVITGIVGGFLGGWLLSLFGFDVESGRRWFTFFTALLGAVILVWLVRMVRSRT